MAPLKADPNDMKKYAGIVFASSLLLAALLLLANAREFAQRTANPSVAANKVMPEVVLLATDAKIGPVTFNHTKHNGGFYTLDGPIFCIQCHHTAQPAKELIKSPPLKTAWPSDRTTTLTYDLFSRDPNGAGVAACRDCHAKEGKKPKLLRLIPVLKDPETGIKSKLTSQLAFHQACDACHFQIGFRTTGSKVPKSTNCLSCHKRK